LPRGRAATMAPQSTEAAGAAHKAAEAAELAQAPEGRMVSRRDISH
jgi:hypothetical protein